MLCDVYMDDIDRLRDAVYHAELKDAEEVRSFVRNLTKLVYDYKMVGMLYDFYTPGVEYYKQKRITFIREQTLDVADLERQLEKALAMAV